MVGVVKCPDATLRGEASEPRYLEGAEVVLRVEEDEVKRFFRNKLKRADRMECYRKLVNPGACLLRHSRIDLERIKMADANESLTDRLRCVALVCARFENAGRSQRDAERAQELTHLDFRGGTVGGMP